MVIYHWDVNVEVDTKLVWEETSPCGKCSWGMRRRSEREQLVAWLTNTHGHREEFDGGLLDLHGATVDVVFM